MGRCFQEFCFLVFLVFGFSAFLSATLTATGEGAARGFVPPVGTCIVAVLTSGTSTVLPEECFSSWSWCASWGWCASWVRWRRWDDRAQHLIKNKAVRRPAAQPHTVKTPTASFLNWSMWSRSFSKATGSTTPSNHPVLLSRPAYQTA